jgi:DNA-binding beta-propeller fold protein YncE
VVVQTGDRIIVADRDAHVLRLVTLAGDVTTFAGDGVPGTIDGPLASARFVGPRALAADGSGAIYVSDDGAHRIRRITPDGVVVTIAGDGTAGYADSSGDMSEFFGQEGLAVTADGTKLYVADGTSGSGGAPYQRLRVITIGP